MNQDLFNSPLLVDIPNVTYRCHGSEHPSIYTDVEYTYNMSI